MTGGIRESKRSLPRPSVFPKPLPGQKDRKTTVKSWSTYGKALTKAEVEEHANNTGIDPAEAARTVASVGKVVLCGACVLAAAKFVVYLRTGSQVIKASMIDSSGDIIGAATTVFVVGISSKQDPVTYPVGTGKVEVVGVLCFSVFLVGCLTLNALNSIEQVLVTERSYQESVLDFLNLLQDSPAEGAPTGPVEKKALAAFLANGANEVSAVLLALLKSISGQSDTEDENALTKAVHGAAQVPESWVKQSSVAQCCVLLAFVISYKACLAWVCFKKVLPKTGSGMIAAVGQDAINDCVGSSLMIFCMVMGLVLESSPYRSLGEKMDPAAATCLCLGLIYIWIQGAMQCAKALSAMSADPEEIEKVRIMTRKATDGCRNLDIANVKAYRHSVQKSVAEIDIKVGAHTPFAEVHRSIRNIEDSAVELNDVERVITNMRLAA